MTQPGSPSDGDLWYDTDDGGMFVYYQDADSSQWVEVIGSQGAPGAAGAAGADGGAGVASVYATVDALPTSGNSQGDMAHVTANNTLYFWNGSGWYKVHLSTQIQVLVEYPLAIVLQLMELLQQ